MWTQDSDFLFLFLNFEKKIANIWRFEWDGMSTIKFETAWLYLLSDIL